MASWKRSSARNLRSLLATRVVYRVLVSSQIRALLAKEAQEGADEKAPLLAAYPGLALEFLQIPVRTLDNEHFRIDTALGVLGADCPAGAQGR